MSIVVSVRTERGERIDSLIDGDALLERLIFRERTGPPRFLQTIDPYGRTIFNRLQLPQVVEELQREIKPLTTTDAERTLVARVIALAERSINEGPHLYLWFEGD